ncbi:RNA polymerase sigma factor [Thermodesulfobacteriota bacterium]
MKNSGAELRQDHEIMLSVRDGNIQELGQLFDRYSKRLYNYFRLQIKDRLKSEDLVQNVFYNILRYRHTYKDSANFKAWMYTIARNEKINYFKKNKSRYEDIDTELPNEKNNTPENDFEHKTDINHLNMALERLPDESRELIILSKFSELPYSRIAELTGCTEGTVKVRVYRAIKKLRDEFTKIAGE